MTVAALEELVAIPSVSGDPARRDDVGRAAAWLAARLGSLGGRVVPTGGHPLVLGEWLGAEGAPTVLVYAHYDVQPAGEEGAWQTPPFEPAVRGERMYGRGTSDDKGPMLAALGAVERLLEERGRLPVNVRILLEGEEEIGSPNLEAALAANREVLEADVAVSADGAMWSAEQPSLNVAARGMLAVDVVGARPGRRPALRAGTAAPSRTRSGRWPRSWRRFTAPTARWRSTGFSDDVVDLTGADREEIGEMPFDDDAYRDEVGAPELHGEPGYTPLERLTARPTLEVSQIEGGGRYTVIPAVARAYLTCRLVPDQDPAARRRSDRPPCDHALPAGRHRVGRGGAGRHPGLRHPPRPSGARGRRGGAPRGLPGPPSPSHPGRRHAARRGRSSRGRWGSTRSSSRSRAPTSASTAPTSSSA